jgi:DNA polymerase-3 subunit gamma/tau
LTQALYNRIRPRTFSQVVGQEHVTDALAAALTSGRLHHAFLFSGPRGCGKTSSARILAASLNCVTGPTPTPCGVCEHCVAIRSGSSMDVIEIDAASHRGIDDAREIRERAIFMPASARFKVYIIDEAHQITSDAFNALLKLVEEPPPHLKFIFATTEPDKVLQTIRSRTHHYAFRLVPPAILRDFLAKVAVDEGVVIDPAVLPLVVRAGAGSVRDSLSVLDQLIAGAGPDGLTASNAAMLLGLSDARVLDDAVEALAIKEPAGAFSVVEQVMATGHDPRRFAMDLLERIRDLLVLQTVPDAPDQGLLAHYAPDQIERMRFQAGRMGASELSRAADLVHAGLIDMRDTLSPRLMLELVLARVLLPGASADPAALQIRLERLERLLAAGATVGAAAPAQAPVAAPAARPAVARPAATRPAASPPAAPAQPAAERPQPVAAPVQPSAKVAPPTADAWPEMATPGRPSSKAPASAPAAAAATESSAPAVSGGPTLAEVVSVWTDLLATIVRRGISGGQSAKAVLAQAQPVRVNDGELVLAFTPPLARVYQSGNAEPLLRDALVDRFSGKWKITVVQKVADAGTVNLLPDEPPPSDDEPDSAADGQRARDHDPVAFAMRELGAQIVDEREAG